MTLPVAKTLLEIAKQQQYDYTGQLLEFFFARDCLVRLNNAGIRKKVLAPLTVLVLACLKVILMYNDNTKWSKAFSRCKKCL